MKYPCPSPGAYANGCRCEACVFQHSRRNKRWRIATYRKGGSLRVPAGPVRRQLKALCRAGWRQVRIAEQVGVCESQISKLILGKNATVHHETADAVARLWELYCTRPEPDRRRFPVQPLVDALVLRYGSLNAVGKESARQLPSRYGERGLPARLADDLAVRWLGRTPEEIWPEFLQEAS